MSKRRAACSCGKLTITIDGEPVRVSVCHCLACQRRTGSAFGAQAWFPVEKVEISGPSTRYVRTGDSGMQIPFHFCPDCGTTMYWRLEDFPGVIAIAVGAFADPTFPGPQVSVYHESRRHRWVNLPDDIQTRG
jgi:hypothetical protein